MAGVLCVQLCCVNRDGRWLYTALFADDGYRQDVSVSAKTRKLIYRIQPYSNAMNEYSLISNIGLTLVNSKILQYNILHTLYCNITTAVLSYDLLLGTVIS